MPPTSLALGRDGLVPLVPCLQRSEAVLEVFESIGQLGIADRAEMVAREPAALRDTRGLLALPERIKFEAE